VRSGELDAANAIAVEKRIAGGPGIGAKEAVSTRNVPSNAKKNRDRIPGSFFVRNAGFSS
jgi:hypothetical protein